MCQMLDKSFNFYSKLPSQLKDFFPPQLYKGKLQKIVQFGVVFTFHTYFYNLNFFSPEAQYKSSMKFIFIKYQSLTRAMHGNRFWMSFRGKKSLFFSWSSKQKCIKLKIYIYIYILKEIVQSFISQTEERNVVLFINICEKE